MQGRRGALSAAGCTLDNRAQTSVSLQGLDEQVVQAVHHGSGVINQPCCDHGVLIDLKGRVVTLLMGWGPCASANSGTF